MDAETQKMCGLIIKLMELGNDEKNNQTKEAQSAKAKVAELMAKYSLSFADLRIGNPKAELYTRLDIDGSEEEYVAWEGTLAHCIGKIFDCRVVSLGGGRKNSYFDPWKLAFLGTKTDIEIAVFFLKYLRRTIGVMSERNVKGIRAQGNYAMGMVTTINLRLEELYKKREEFIPSDCKALVVQKKDGVNEFTKSQFSHLVKIKHSTSYDDNYHRGRKEGERINLSRPISNNNHATGAIA